MAREAWDLAHNQHGVVSSDQLREVGYTPQAIYHRIRTGRLHPLHRGVYAVGRPHVTDHGRWIAAVIACGAGAVLSHSSAAALWRIGSEKSGLVELSLPSLARRCRPGLQIHQRPSLRNRDMTVEFGIPVTTPVQTLIDMALRLDRRGIERAINEADKYDLVHPPELRKALDERSGEPGVACLREILDRRTFRLTKEELERRFLPLASKAGLPVPLTGQWVNEFEVTSTGRTWGWWSRPTGSATTVRRPSRRETGCGTRRTPPPGSPSSASRTSRCATNRSTCGRSSLRRRAASPSRRSSRAPRGSPASRGWRPSPPASPSGCASPAPPAPCR